MMEVSSFISLSYLLGYAVTAVITLWLVLYINFHRVSVSKDGNGFRRMLGIPFIGKTLEFAFLKQDDIYHLIRWAGALNTPLSPVDRLRLGLWEIGKVEAPDAVGVLLSSKEHITKSMQYELIWPWLGNGLLLSTGKKWSARRKMLTPAFHFQILEEFIKVFNDQSQILLTILKKETSDFDLVSHITPCTLDIICEATMGVKLGTQTNRDSEYIRSINRVTEIFAYRNLRPWLHSEFIFSLTKLGREHRQLLHTLHGYTDHVIKKRREELLHQKEIGSISKTSDVDTDEKRKRLAFLDQLLKCAEEDETLTEKDIREEVDTFMFEGHDTTAMAISWCLFLLGTSPDHQVRVHEELDSIFGDSDRPATMSDLTQMTYLDMCIKETLRLYPSVPMIGRHIEKNITILDGTILKGTNLLISLVNLHRRHENFPNPEVFNPDHFLPDRVAQRHPFAYVPFSAGPRNCIGQKFAMLEQKVIISTILRRFKVTAMESREDMIILSEVILRPKYGLKVRLEPRQK